MHMKYGWQILHSQFLCLLEAHFLLGLGKVEFAILTALPCSSLSYHTQYLARQQQIRRTVSYWYTHTLLTRWAVARRTSKAHMRLDSAEHRTCIGIFHYISAYVHE